MPALSNDFGFPVTSFPNGKYVSEITIKASDIVELVEAVSENAAPANRPPRPKAIPVVDSPRQTFEDPAILSVGRPTPVSKPSLPTSWSGSAMAREDSAKTATGREERALRDITPTTTLVEPMQKITSTDEPEEENEERHILDEITADPEVMQGTRAEQRKRRARNRGKGRKGGDEPQDPATVPAKPTKKSQGWRQTPLLEPNPSFQPFDTINKRKGRRGGKMEENGWATEDATDVQEMGDFDFVGSLAKFDKRTVFSQLEAEDSVADEDRLVSHNRLPRAKPGTAGGKNLAYNETVLDKPKSTNGTPKMVAAAWKGEDSDVEGSPRGSGSARHSRRADSKLAANRRPVDTRPISRKGSTNNSIPPARTMSVSDFSLPKLYNTKYPADSNCSWQTSILRGPL